MKKLLLLILVAIMLVTAMPVAFAENDINELTNQFISGVDDETYDYFYYSPVKSSLDKTKYPIILWLHGQLSGDFKGDQIKESDIAYLSTEENQAKIKGTKGAFILVPRYPTLDVSLAWTGENSNIKKFIDKFIADHKANVDTSRIYVGGYSMGGKAAIKFAAAYPNYVAAIFPASSIYLGADCRSDLRSLINTPVWFFTCKEDDFWGKPTPQSDDWSYFCSIANNKADIRWTQFTMNYGNDSGLLNYDGTRIKTLGYKEHNTWDPMLHDLIMKDGNIYPNIISTVNGYNAQIELTIEESFISWLSSQSCNGTVSDSENSYCDVNGHTIITLSSSKPSCDKPGKTAGSYCDRCGIIFEEQEEIEPLGHSLYWSVIKEATCAYEGEKIEKCEYCNYESETVYSIPKYEHIIEDIEYKSATCTEAGVCVIGCCVCGEVDETIIIPEKGHDYQADWQTIVKPKCDEVGVAIKICKNCFNIRTSDIMSVNHLDANSDYKCDYGCGYEFEQPTPEAPDEPEVKLNFFQKIIQWFKNLFAKLFGWL